MTTIRLKDNTSLEVVIENAVDTDARQLMQLNSKWQKATLGENISDGYVGALFSADTFLELIQRKQVVVARTDNNIIGYYLLNDFSKDGIIGRHEDMVAQLKSEEVIDHASRICVGAQAIVDRAYMGSGIRKLMLDKLVANMKHSYDYLFATIAKDNTRAYTAHTRDGWKVIGEEEQNYYVLYKV